MSITRVKAAGWGVNEKLTSAQMTQVDINAASALDKRSGQTDTLASTITVTGTLTLNAPLVANDLSTFNGTAVHNDAVTFNDIVTFGSGSAVSVAGGWQFNSTPVFAAGLTVNGGTTTLGGSAVAVNSNLTGDVGSTWLLNGPVVAGNFSLGASNRVQFVSPRHFSRILCNFQHGGDWTPLSTGILSSFVATPVSDTPSGFFVLDDMPDGCTLTGLAVRVMPHVGHVGLPAQLPVLSVYSVDFFTGSTALLDSGTMSPANVAAYETLQYIVTAPGVVLDRTRYKYVAHLSGESGANAANSFKLYGAVATFTSSQMDRY